MGGIRFRSKVRRETLLFLDEGECNGSVVGLVLGEDISQYVGSGQFGHARGSSCPKRQSLVGAGTRPFGTNRWNPAGLCTVAFCSAYPPGPPALEPDSR